MKTICCLLGLAMALPAGAQEIIPSPLIVSLEGSERVSPQSDVTHTITVLNRGSDTAKGLVLRASLPPVLQYRNRTEGPPLRWNLGDLPAGGIFRTVFTTRTPAEGSGKLEASVYDAGGGCVAGPRVKEIRVVDGATLLVNLDRTAFTAYAGMTHALSVEVRNPSKVPMTGIQVEIPTPDGMEFVEAAGPTASRVGEGNKIRFEPISSMHPGDRLTCVLRFKALRPGFATYAPTVAYDPGTQPITEERWINIRPAAPAGTVWFRANVRSESSMSVLIPDVIFVDGKPWTEEMAVPVGARQVIVEKKGYQKFEKNAEIADPRNEGLCRLEIVLTPKPRVLIFEIRDKNTGSPILPDKVQLSTPAGSVQVREGESIKPGAKRILVQKEGYRDIEEDLVIAEDETPCPLRYQMVPK